MRRNWFYILVSLAEGERHGLAIMRDVLALTEDELPLWPASLYGTLEELAERGWVRATDTPQQLADGAERGHRKWFRLTPAGRAALSAEVARMEGVASVARQRLLHPGGAA
jgi:DNA-binding PadR family transcriptional regulator